MILEHEKPKWETILYTFRNVCHSSLDLRSMVLDPLHL